MNNVSVPHTSSPVFDTVLSLLRSAIWGESRFPFHAPEDTDWEAVYKELKMQTVQHLPVDILAREDPQKKQLYTANTVRNMMFWYKIMQVQQDLCQQLQAAGIPCAVVKGAAAACYYPQPSKRVMGDIDLLVHPEDFDRACQVLSEGAEYIGENHRHKEYRKNGIIFEIHHAFATLRNANKNSVLDTYLFSAITAAEEAAIDSYSFRKLSSAPNGLSLLLHIDVHLESGLGLRQIIDWMMFVDREMTDELWYNNIEPMLNQLERKKLAVTITRMCQIYLGLRDEIAWCKDADEQLCRKLMEYILTQGNFGRKSHKRLNRMISVIDASKNGISFFKILQQRGCLNWKATIRYPFLKKFAWLYQIIRYLYFGLRTEHPIQLLRKASSNLDSKTSLMEALGASRMSLEG